MKSTDTCTDGWTYLGYYNIEVFYQAYTIVIGNQTKIY